MRIGILSSMLAGMMASIGTTPSHVGIDLAKREGARNRSGLRRQTFRSSKSRDYREQERAKNRASLKAMGLSSNVADWPVKHQPEWARKKFPK